MLRPRPGQPSGRKTRNVLLGGVAQPDTIWTDRGKGFYCPNNGVITAMYKAALHENHFKAALGDNGSVQPGNLQELMLHETAVAWIRLRLARTLPAKAWEETREAYATRLKNICDEIKSTLDVEGLCRGFLARVAKLIEQRGGRLSV